MSDLPLLIKRVMTHGVTVYPYQLNTILKKYEVYKIPDDILSKLKEGDIKKYVKALYLSGQEMAGDWSEGHRLLGELGFERVERVVGHRIYISMVYKQEVL